MTRYAGALIALFLAGCTLSYSPSSGNDLPKQTPGTDAQRAEAVAAARFYAGVLDRGDYELTWTLGAPALRASTSHFMWINAMKLGAKMRGAPGARAVDGVAFTTQIDASTPVGEYAIVEFKSTGENSVTTERVVLQQERKRWKIAGYFVAKRG